MSWRKIRVYGTLQKTTTFRRRYWHTRKDGPRQRYWHKITQKTTRNIEKHFDEKEGNLKQQITDWTKTYFGRGYHWIEKGADY